MTYITSGSMKAAKAAHVMGVVYDWAASMLSTKFCIINTE